LLFQVSKNVQTTLEKTVRPEFFEVLNLPVFCKYFFKKLVKNRVKFRQKNFSAGFFHSFFKCREKFENAATTALKTCKKLFARSFFKC